MTENSLDDFSFLTELIRLTDADPSADTAGRDVAASLGQPDANVEPNVQRLKRRGLIDFTPGPKRMSDGWETTPLIVTPEGYRFDQSGLTR